ncbi:hypothetical protein E6W39_02705 [Kitasatospora acidiphila]|uniref:Uncharacterized protein n=1 Tax=Kitasatospora acidiphila TaxID=2567942 RepID=A0A540VX49_9ACTN|nr:hypothetical protein E6W39_02705 [Kitasatospora acidiphila]
MELLLGPSQANPTKRDVSPKADREGATCSSESSSRMATSWQDRLADPARSPLGIASAADGPQPPACPGCRDPLPACTSGLGPHWQDNRSVGHRRQGGYARSAYSTVTGAWSPHCSACMTACGTLMSLPGARARMGRLRSAMAGHRPSTHDDQCRTAGCLAVTHQAPQVPAGAFGPQKLVPAMEMLSVLGVRVMLMGPVGSQLGSVVSVTVPVAVVPSVPLSCPEARSPSRMPPSGANESHGIGAWSQLI